MTWINASSNSEFWTERLRDNEVPLFDQSGNQLIDDSGNVLIFGTVATWSDAAANSEAWVAA